MPGFPSYECRVYPPCLAEDRRAVSAFLQERGLSWEADVEFTVACFQGGTMVATGSLAGRVIKCLAVDEALRGEGLAAAVVSRLEAEAASRGIANPFVFTSTDNEGIFASLGYRPIGGVAGAVVLMEKGNGLDRWTRSLEALAAGLPETGGPVSALVMNCNPFTLGHLHLVRTASETSGRVFLFAVSEDASAFPTTVRHRLIREETGAFPNVVVVPGTEYLVSRATFPSYFLKGDAGRATEIHARLDVDLFGRRIAPAVGAVRRYVGEEPYCPVTATYNRVMKEVLPAQGIQVVEIPRLARDEVAISASEVRRLVRRGELEAALELVPPRTAAYLRSPEAAPVLARVASGGGRH